MAILGCSAIVIGIFHGLIHVASGYEGMIMTGWDGDPNHEEILLAQLGVVGVAGSVAALRWNQIAIVPSVVGGIVLFYVIRTMVTLFQSPNIILYREFSPRTPGFEGETTFFVLGAEPFLLAAGGLLFVIAGIKQLKRGIQYEGDGDMLSSSSSQ
jgi:hypothetical protein